jgi:xanthine phosphoribosyltransferase
MLKIDFSEFCKKLNARLEGERFDAVVGIARGGMVPACVAAAMLLLPLQLLTLRMYDDGMPPKKVHAKPKAIGALPDVANMRVLLMDDFSKSGATLREARRLLMRAGAKEVKALVVAGGCAEALCKTSECVEFPWETKRK